MSPNEHLTIGEHDRSQKALERTIMSGFERMDKRFDEVGDNLKDHAERLAVLESERGKRLKPKLSGAGWGTVLAGAGAALFEGFKWYRK
jgi:hypothetical protein